MVDPEKQLAWEKPHRPRAAIAALIASVALAVYYVLEQIVVRDLPSTSGLETFVRAVRDGPVGQLPSLRIPYFEYLDGKSSLLFGRAIAGLIGFVGVAWTVGFLGVAARARLANIRRYVLYLPIIGGVITGIGVLVAQIGTSALINDFLAGPRTVAAADDQGGGISAFGNVLSQFGTLALAVGTVIVSLNAMRAGLLTRMLGYIGIASGAMLVLFPLPIVQIFWLGALGFVLLGRWPGGELPAWQSGQAVPWATPERRPPRQRRGASAPAPEPATPAPTPARRKRKKRQ